MKREICSDVVLPVRLEPPVTLDSVNTAFSQLDIQPWRGEYRLCWTGWKAAQETTLLVAQWLALGGERQFYSSVPGIADSYLRGETFDLSRQNWDLCFYLDDLLLQDSALLERLSRIKLSGYERLVAVMTEQGAL